MRRKYKYRSRALAEEAQRDSERDKRLAEWLLTAWMDNRQIIVGESDGYKIGFVTLRHHSLVFAIRTETDSIHRISGIWLSDDSRLRYIFEGFQRQDLQCGHLLESAAKQADERENGGEKC